MSMSAKELLKFIGPVESGSKWEFCAEHQATILRALSLLAAVEDGDEIVRYLNKDAARLLAKSKQVPSTAGQMKYEEISRKQANAAARIVSDAQEIAALKGENEKLREACAAGWGEPALINTLKAELAQARTTSQFHKDNHLAAEAELASVKAHAKALFALGTDLKQAVQHFTGKGHATPELDAYRAAFPKEGA